MTICGQGTIQETIEQAFELQIREWYRTEKGVDIPEDMPWKEVMDNYGRQFMDAKFPGALINPLVMISQMASQNPDSLVEAEVAVAGGSYDPCGSMVPKNETKNATMDDASTSEANMTESDRCDWMSYDSVGSMCYGAGAAGQMDYASAKTYCQQSYGGLFDFSGDINQLFGLTETINGKR